MAHTSFRTIWLQATVLIALTRITKYEMQRGGLVEVLKDPGFKNLTDVLDMSYMSQNVLASSAPALDAPVVGTLDGSSNATAPNHHNNTTAATNGTAAGGEPERNFYTYTFPRALLADVLTVPLIILFHVLLEWLLPARPRRLEVDRASTAVQEKRAAAAAAAGEGEGEDGREEEVIQRWIARGRVRRSSISWCNTFCKWLLYLTVGTVIMNVWFMTCHRIILWMPWEKVRANLLTDALWVTLNSMVFSIVPLSSLIAFITVPAPQRLVFTATGSLVFSVFYNSFVKIVVPWVIRTDLAQGIMSHMTATILFYHENPDLDPGNPNGRVQQGILNAGGRQFEEL